MQGTGPTNFLTSQLPRILGEKPEPNEKNGAENGFASFFRGEGLKEGRGKRTPTVGPLKFCSERKGRRWESEKDKGRRYRGLEQSSAHKKPRKIIFKNWECFLLK